MLVVLRAVCGVVVLDVVLAFLLAPEVFPRRLLVRLTAPLYRPVQRVFDPELTGVDFSPMVVVMAITTLAWILAPESLGG